MADLILKGAKGKTPHVNKGVGECFFEQAEKYPDRIFQVDGVTGQTETYFVTKQRTTRVAIRLQKMDIKPKDVVMICCQNNINNVIPALSAQYLGAYAASVDPRQTVSDAQHVISLASPKILFVEENSLAMVEEALKNASIDSKIIVIGKSDRFVTLSDMEKEIEEEKDFRPLKQKGSDIAVMLFSSGTTSAPKGIYISNSYIMNCGWRSVQHNSFKPDVLMHLATLYWISSWVLLGSTIYYATTKVAAQGVTGEKFLQLVEKFKITHVFFSSPYTYEITNLPEEVLKKYDTSSLYSVCIGGSTMDPNQVVRIRKALPKTFVALFYGSSEAGSIGIPDFTNTKAYEEKLLSSGTAVCESEIKVADLETGKPLGPNQEGEFRVKSPFLMSGYHNFSKPDIYDEDGFFKTGDLGYYDEDKYIYVTDRINEMFKYQTFHVSPSLVEHALLNHPAVAEAVVFGVFHPVDRNHPAACVVLRSGMKADVNELIEFVNAKMTETHKLRGGLMIIDAIPRTPSGKIQRRSVRDLFIKANKKH